MAAVREAPSPSPHTVPILPSQLAHCQAAYPQLLVAPCHWLVFSEATESVQIPFDSISGGSLCFSVDPRGWYIRGILFCSSMGRNKVNAVTDRFGMHDRQTLHKLILVVAESSSQSS
jgi:hypothetical protein